MKRIILISILTSTLLLTGCGYEQPKIVIVDYNKSFWNSDDITIDVVQAEAGLQGFETIETYEGIDVVLHYRKKER